MAILDIRETESSPITEIVYSDTDSLEKSGDYVVITDKMDDCEFHISHTDIKDLIKALQKAVELGWLGGLTND